MKRYPAEQIHYDMGGVVCEDDELAGIVAAALSKAPNK